METKRTLTPDQIEDLYAFCEEHCIFQYDVQIELVDHLACAIEKKWNEELYLSYENALWSVYDDFGVSGFSKIRTAKEKELKRKYFILEWRYIGEFFHLPKIILTVFITFLIMLMYRITSNYFVVSIGSLCIYIVGLVGYLSFNAKAISISLIPEKYFLLMDHFQLTKWKILAFCIAPFNFWFGLYLIGKEYSSWGINQWFIELLTAFMLTFFIIFSIVATIHIPKRIKEDFTREFPQFVKV